MRKLKEFTNYSLKLLDMLKEVLQAKGKRYQTEI